MDTNKLKILSCAGVWSAALFGALVARADFDWFDVAFTSYAVGEVLSDKGVTHGTWGSPAVAGGDVAVVALEDARKFLDYSADRLVLTADRPAGEQKEPSAAFVTTRFFDPANDEQERGTWKPPSMGAATRAAHCIGYGAKTNVTFFGYTKEGWVELQNEEIPPTFGEWQDWRVRFHAENTGLSVDYAIKKGAKYLLLQTKEGVSRFSCPGTAQTWQKVVLSGSGSVSGLNGTMRRGLFTVVR